MRSTNENFNVFNSRDDIYLVFTKKVNFLFILYFLERGSFMVWGINMGVCPRLECDNIMFINCLGYDFYIYGAFEFLCNSIANL